MTDIFISYAKEDRESVAPLAKALEDAGWTVWWDWHIPVGKTWRQVIAEAIVAAKCVLVLWSKTSVNKNWVIEEAEYGLKKNIYVPALIEDTDPPFGF